MPEKESRRLIKVLRFSIWRCFHELYLFAKHISCHAQFRSKSLDYNEHVLILWGHLLTVNYRVVPTEIGGQWKHGFVRGFPGYRGDEAVRLIICVKHPLSWLNSFYCWCQNNTDSNNDFRDPGLRLSGFSRSASFAEFLRMPCYEHKNPVERWNAMNQHWTTLSNSPDLLQVVRAEDMYDFQGQLAVLGRIEQAFGCERRRMVLRTEQRRIAPGGMVMAKPMNSVYYLQHRYLQSYSFALIRFVWEQLDQKMTTLLNYALPECNHSAESVNMRSEVAPHAE